MNNSIHLGSKADRLTQLKNKGYSVPNFFVISESEKLTTTSIKTRLNELKGSEFAVRSSANVEDGHSASFAGQFKTKLFVKREEIQAAIEEVRNSKLEVNVIDYCALFNIPHDSIIVNVIVQEMIDADQSGVAFGFHFTSKKKVINSVYGLGIGIVDGELSADEFIETTNGWRSKIQSKPHAYAYTNETISKIDVASNLSQEPSLNKNQISYISEILDHLSKEFEQPQDIEFCYKDDHFYLLQSRDITTQNKEVVIWDNSNIVESYPGITSPFTFSFIKNIYSKVYKNFAEMLGVSQKQISANQDVFEEMLGHIKGRVYYHLINWYKALALLPGYKLNAPLMEKMMGVDEPLDTPISVKQPLNKTKAILQLGISIIKLFRTNLRLPKLKKEFTNLVNQEVIQYRSKDYSSSKVTEIWEDYENFKNLLVNRWQPPLANDLFAMIYFGSLQSFCEKNFDEPTLHTKLVAGRYTVNSTKPALLVEKIIQKSTEENRIAQIKTMKPESIWEQCQKKQFGATGQLILDYIDEFGDRSVGELKLENDTFRQRPSSFIEILSTYESYQNQQVKVAVTKAIDIEHTYARKLSTPKRWWFTYLVKKAAETVADRENLRLERTRVFGIVRKIINAVGVEFHSSNLIAEPKDIFFLTEQEIRSYIKTRKEELALIIAQRKEEFSHFSEYKNLPNRITQIGNLKENDFISKTSISTTLSDLTGIPSCEGIVRKRVRVVSSPNDVASLNGDILITKSTDPGWITIFKSASGVIVERGSSLSHASIVCREMNIPCIVAVKGVTSAIKTGDLIQMDGSKGVIEIIERASN